MGNFAENLNLGKHVHLNCGRPRLAVRPRFEGVLT